MRRAHTIEPRFGRQTPILLLAALFCLASFGCDGKSANSSVCADIDCSGHGLCSSLSGRASCLCDTGFRNDGETTCVRDVAEPCESISDCDDGNPCTDEQCDLTLGCQRQFHSRSCDDGLFCNGNETCDGAGNCVSAGEPCSAQCRDLCDEAADTCSQPSADNTPCDDGLFCTVDATCQGGSCSNQQPRDCSGFDSLCADGQCNEDSDACYAEPKADTTACDDGNSCTGNHCQSGACVDDGSDLTGQGCTVSATDDGICVAGTPPTCLLVDGEPCTSDSECRNGFCECGDADCTSTVCGALDCDCSFNADGAAPCDGPLNGGVDDADDSCGALFACDGAGACNVGPGELCSSNGQCGSGHCECVTQDCTAYRCSEVDCDCGFNGDSDGTCDGNLDEGLHDLDESCGPVERCDGADGCRASIRLEYLSTTATPAPGTNRDGMALYTNGAGERTVITLGTYRSGSTDWDIDVYSVDGDADPVFWTSFIADGGGGFAHGSSDEPSVAVGDNAPIPNATVNYVAIDATTGAPTSTVVNLPANMNANFTNTGVIHKQGDELYLYSFTSETVARANLTDAAPVTATTVFDNATAGLPGTLHDFYVGQAEIYGILDSDALIVWDRDFNFLRSVPFLPAETIGYTHYGGTETILFSPEDGIIYLLSSNHVHLIAGSTYYYVGGGDTRLTWYEFYGGWGVRDNEMRTYDTSADEMHHWRIHFE